MIYYQDKNIVLHYGDCREIAPTLGRFDLLLTDPPYGIGADNRKQILSRGKLAVPKDYGDTCWELCEKQIIFGGNYFTLPPTTCWLIWDKLNGDNDFADCEMAWTNLKKAVRRKVHLWNGMIRKGGEDRYHPTQKPLEVIAWALGHAGEVKTILDPFAGSGTTGRAAKDLGLHCTMIEREERYCEIAALRMSQEVLL